MSWNACPSARAGPFASGVNGSSTGSIISPITAAEPSMYPSRRSSHVSQVSRVKSEAIASKKRSKHSGSVPRRLMLSTMAAIVDSIRRRGTDPECFERFFDAMASDLDRDAWSTWEELRDGYMEGSAAVIGEMMLPVLEPYSPEAKESARALGNAFQLTNFLRDVAEDLDRGRVYLPQEDLARHGADPWLRTVTPEWRAMMAEQVARARELYAQGQEGLALLPPASRRCVGTALVLYSRILDRIEAADYDVFSGRLRVPDAEKLAVMLRSVALGVPHVDFGRAGAAA